MIISTQFDRCSICLEPKPLTSEHIIPESIGGTLSAELQCVDCNSNLGSELVSQAKQDPVLRLAIWSLRNKLPELYLSMEQGQRYYAKDVSGKEVPVKLKVGRFETEPHKREDGSLILDTKKGEKNMRQQLAKEGLTSNEIERSIQQLREAPENTQIRLSSERVAIKWGVESFFPTLEKPEMDPRLVALVAYNYLCLLLGKDIFNDWFDFLRRFILSGVQNDRLTIETFSSRKYTCFHRLYPEFSHSGTKISLELFGWLVYIIQIKDLIIRAPNAVYIEDLKNKRFLLAESIEQAKRGEFHSNRHIPYDTNEA